MADTDKATVRLEIPYAKRQLILIGEIRSQDTMERSPLRKPGIYVYPLYMQK